MDGHGIIHRCNIQMLCQEVAAAGGRARPHRAFRNKKRARGEQRQSEAVEEKAGTAVTRAGAGAGAGREGPTNSVSSFGRCAGCWALVLVLLVLVLLS